MKKVASLLLIFLIFANISAVSANDGTNYYAEQAEKFKNVTYPAYYGTKKCVIADWNNTETNFPNLVIGDYNFKQIIEYDNDKEFITRKSSTLYKNDEKFAENIWDLIFSKNDEIVVYSKKSDEENLYDIFENDKKITTIKSEYGFGKFDELHYYEDTNEYAFTFGDKIIINGKVVDQLFLDEKYFSEDKKSKITLKGIPHPNDPNENITNLFYNDKKIYDYLNPYDVFEIANNQNGFIIAGKTHNYGTGKNENWKITENGIEIIENEIIFAKFSPSGKDLYTIIEKNQDTKKYDEMPRDYTLYKNQEKILDFQVKMYKHEFGMHFDDENNYRIYHINGGPKYLVITNGKITQTGDEEIVTVLDYVDESGKKFLIERNQKTSVEILFVNGQKIFEGKDIDERFISGEGAVFSIFPLVKPNFTQWYTYVDDFDGKYFLYVNGFKIENFYDYLHLDPAEGLNRFSFAGYGNRIECRDITAIHDAEIFQKIIVENLEKIRDGSELQKQFIREYVAKNISKYEKDSFVYDIFKSLESATRIHNR